MEFAKCEYCGEKFDKQTIEAIVKNDKNLHINDKPHLWKVSEGTSTLGLYFGQVEDIAGYLSANTSAKILSFTKILGPKIHKILPIAMSDNSRPIAIKFQKHDKSLSHDEELAFWNFIVKNQNVSVKTVLNETCFLNFK
jgi:hypothetical protein